MVNGNQNPQRGTAHGVNQRQKETRRAVVAFREPGDGGKELALVGRGRRVFRSMKQRIEGDSVAGEILEGQIDPVARRILGHIAQNVGQLECNSSFLSQLFRAQVAVAEDADADQAHDRGHQVAVAVEIGKRSVCVRLAGGNVVQIQGDAGYKLIQEFEWNLEALCCR